MNVLNKLKATICIAFLGILFSTSGVASQTVLANSSKDIAKSFLPTVSTNNKNCLYLKGVEGGALLINTCGACVVARIHQLPENRIFETAVQNNSNVLLVGTGRAWRFAILGSRWC